MPHRAFVQEYVAHLTAPHGLVVQQAKIEFKVGVATPFHNMEKLSVVGIEVKDFNVEGHLNGA